MPKKKKAEKVEVSEVSKGLGEGSAPQPKKERWRGKKYKEAQKLIEKDKEYPIEEAIELVKKTSTTKFDASVEVHFRLADIKNISDVRGMVSLPFGTGRQKIVAVFCEADKQKQAKEAGADFVGDEDLIEKVSKGWTGFDIAVATPPLMPKLAKVAKVLGTKGLMPNPKSGTITEDVAETVKEIKKGKVEFRADSFGIIHQVIGKVSFESDKILQNYEALKESIMKVRSGLAKNIFKSVYLASSMGPAVKVKVD